MERVLDRLSQRRVNPLREQTVETRALIHLVEVHEWPPLVEHAGRTLGRDRRSLRVVEHPLDEVARRQEILEPLLILNADQIAAVAIGEPHRGHVHPALEEHLLPR